MGLKPVSTGDRRLAPVARVVAPTPALPVTDPKAATVGQSVLAAATSEAAATPPVDLERVARIRKAIADGKFPIYPARIADRLIALKLEWNPHEDRS